MFPFLVIIFSLFLLGIVFILYAIRSYAISGWKIAQHEQPSSESGTPGDYEKKWLFAGPPVNRKQEIHLMLAHYPKMMLRFFRLMLYKGPQFLTHVVKYRIKHGKWGVSPTFSDEDLYNVFINSPLLLMANYEGDNIGFTIPDMPLTMNEGVNPAGLELVFNVKMKTIVSAKHQSKEILGDNGTIASLLITTLAFWAHPQTHVAAEKSAREIASKKIEGLEPSNKFVVALHYGLLYYSNSPISPNHSLSTNVNRVSGIESSTTIPLKHVFDPRKMEFRYYNFLMQSRGVVAKHLKEFELDVNLDFLFNNMVVHSVDHYLLYQNISKEIWNMDGGQSIKSYWKSVMFANIWVSDLDNILEEEKIGKLSAKKYPFYNAVYNDLAKADKELADCILASTSF